MLLPALLHTEEPRDASLAVPCSQVRLRRPSLRMLTIAEQLVLSAKTVRNYITEIFSKLQVADRAKAIIKARGAGLGAE